MPTIVIGVVVLVLLLWGLSVLSKANPRTIAAVVKGGGGILALLLAGFLGLRGRIDMAIPLGVFGLALLGWMPFGPAGFGARTQRSRGQASRVRSAFLEMELDHDTGAMRGWFLAGPYEGRTLESLDVTTLTGCLPNIDEESRALLAAYLDRREPGWREHVEPGASGGDAAPARGGKMTEEEAYQILGLQKGARAEEIRRAHRSLMKKLHPDQGGSTYLAARINEAKETLLRRHR